MKVDAEWIVLLLICLLLSGCAAQRPSRLVIAPPAPKIIVSWDNYANVDMKNILWEVWESPDIHFITAERVVVNTNRLSIMQAKPMALFKVRATNTLTGEVSPWATR